MEFVRQTGQLPVSTKMADSSAAAGTGKGFSRVVQKTVFRTKEKVLQNLGKADKTRDDELDQSLDLFNEQQNVASKLQKELKRYITNLRDMCLANQSMLKTLKETYEPEWPGYTEVAASLEHNSILWDDYVVKTNEVLNSVTSYCGIFPDIRLKIAKRGRKLTDYDAARHNHDSLMNAKKRDDSKIAKALDELNEAKSVYETINTELHDELPTVHNSRIETIASIFNQLFSADILFQEESTKLKKTMTDVTQKLMGDGNCTFQISKPKNLDSESDNPRKPSISAGNSLKLNNGQEKSRSHLSHYEGVPSAKQTNVVPPPRPYSTQPSTSSTSSAHVPQKLNNLNSSYASADSRQFPEESFVTAKSPGSISSPKTLVDSDDESDSEDNGLDDRETMAIAAASAVHHDNVYSIAQPLDDDPVVYAVPKSNAPAKISNVVPTERVLFRVQATHAYEGEDVDELTFEAGEIITVIPFDDPEEQDEGWLLGVKETTRDKGVFPENFTKRILD